MGSARASEYEGIVASAASVSSDCSIFRGVAAGRKGGASAGDASAASAWATGSDCVSDAADDADDGIPTSSKTMSRRLLLVLSLMNVT